jgi:hypothetical protein
MRHFLPIIAIGICAVAVCELDGQTPTPTPTPPPLPNAIVSYSATQSVVAPSDDGIFQLVGLQPDEVVQVTINCEADWELGENIIETLDGGILLGATQSSTKSITIPTGTGQTISFSFQAKHNPGRNQISIQKDDRGLVLQFWVLQSETPQDNPHAITPETPTP